MRVDILAIGKLSKSPFQDLIDTYLKRMKWTVEVTEIPTHAATTNEQENTAILTVLDKKATPQSRIVALDERGKNLSSMDLSRNIEKWMNGGCSHILFIIGGADGLNDAVRSKASLLLSFGKLTWPHKMVRAMLCEQIYRSQQIIAGHPYHRE